MFELEKAYWCNVLKKLFGKKKEEDVKTEDTTKMNSSIGDSVPGKWLTFDPRFVLPDNLFDEFREDYDITRFLNQQESFLETYICNGKSVEQIIKDACRPYHENCKWILISLHREQSMLGRKDITEIKTYTKLVKDANGQVKTITMDPMQWCLGFGALDDKEPMEKFRGFDNQIYNAARRCRELFEQGKDMLGKDFETIDYTNVTEKMKEAYLPKDGDNDEMLANKQKFIKNMLAKAQYNQTNAEKYNLKLSNSPEKNILVPIQTKWAYMLLMYTPHIDASLTNYKLWMKYFPGDLIC